jgi:hypothetical protein
MRLLPQDGLQLAENRGLTEEAGRFGRYTLLQVFYTEPLVDSCHGDRNFSKIPTGKRAFSDPYAGFITIHVVEPVA